MTLTFSTRKRDNLWQTRSARGRAEGEGFPQDRLSEKGTEGSHRLVLFYSRACLAPGPAHWKSDWLACLCVHACVHMCVHMCTCARAWHAFVCMRVYLCAHVHVCLYVMFTEKQSLFREIIPATPPPSRRVSSPSAAAPAAESQLHPSLSLGTQCPASHLCM